jgi:hypothetical protein
MDAIRCAVCRTRFSGRSDAVYCSPACRQKAHRARTARRTKVLREYLRRTSVAPRSPVEATRTLQRSVASSLQRARDQVDRSRELCRMTERRLAEGSAYRNIPSDQAPDAAQTPLTRHPLWRGN